MRIDDAGATGDVRTGSTVLNRRPRRHRAAFGAMSLVVLLGVNACTGDKDTPATSTADSPAGSSTARAASPPAPPSSGTPAPPPASPVLSESEQARVSAARKSAALANGSIGHPLPRKTVTPMRDMRITQTGNLKK